ncbi:MAG: hypothetical protein HQM12_21200 [SAR324 cluster bacterium]|nr:hypothetical protein [SAR324 cluster bacterium]
MKESPEKEYKSPERKLLRVFREGRDQWKRKCQEGKQVIKFLRNRVAFLESSKAQLKARVKELEQEVRTLRSGLAMEDGSDAIPQKK